MSDEKSLCQICGEPMPDGEEMFNYHGYSGPCPKGAGQSAPLRSVSLMFAWFDCWIGAYFDRKARILYLCPIPMICVKIQL